MKTLILPLLGVFLLFACNPEEPETGCKENDDGFIEWVNSTDLTLIVSANTDEFVLDPDQRRRRAYEPGVILIEATSGGQSVYEGRQVLEACETEPVVFTQ